MKVARSLASFVRWPRGWAWALIGVVTAMGASEALLLELGRTFFSGGYNGRYIDTLPLITAFFGLGAVLDAALVVGVWAVVTPILRRTPGSALQHLALCVALALALPFAMDFANYRLQHVLGDMVSIPGLWEVSTTSVSELASGATPHLGPLLTLLGLAALATGLAVFAIGRLERASGTASTAAPGTLAPPAARAMWVPFTAAVVAATASLTVFATFLPAVHYGLSRKPSVILLSQAIWRATDLDGDGFGALSRPADPSPFDASIHPYAIDWPDNGIDENGIAGDHPTQVRALEPDEVPPIAGARRPHFLLVYLESFRADLIDQRFRDREITPFLNRLGREGASSAHAYVHSPYTAVSRGQLFGGRLDPVSGQSTLIDDFKGLGYRVAQVSGQDDTYGDGLGLMGSDRADYFYDARQDRDLRTSRSTSPAGLQVSWKLVSRRVSQYLAKHDPDELLFLYVNIVDTHHPYHHSEIDDILAIDPVSASEMSVDQAERIRETYYNTAANVDRAVEQIVDMWRGHLGDRDQAILITADHGQALFEAGFLGHGQSLTEAQTRVPLILHGTGGDWPEPIGAAEIRSLVRRHVFDEKAGPGERFVPDREHRFLQAMPRRARPRLLGVRSYDRAVLFDFSTSRLHILGAGDQRIQASKPERRAALRDLIWHWEAHSLRIEQNLTLPAPVYR